jgi:hypothetical protein
MKPVKKKKSGKLVRYRKILDELERQFYGGDYEDYSCGNTMGLYVRNPARCEALFDRF